MEQVDVGTTQATGWSFFVSNYYGHVYGNPSWMARSLRPNIGCYPDTQI